MESDTKETYHFKGHMHFFLFLIWSQALIFQKVLLACL